MITLRNLLLLILLALPLLALVRRVAPAASRLVLRRNDVHFPTVSGFNLERQELEFPRDFAGELNVVFVPFLQQQQEIVNTWIPFVQEAEATHPDVVYYELPTIDEMPSLARLWVNEGMRAGIPDPTARERTVTVYVDTARFMEATAIPGKGDVHTLLVDQQGEILWRTTGPFTAAKGDALLDFIQSHQ